MYYRHDVMQGRALPVLILPFTLRYSILDAWLTHHIIHLSKDLPCSTLYCVC